MTLGVGGSTIEKEFGLMEVLSPDIKAIPKSEYYARIKNFVRYDAYQRYTSRIFFNL